MINFRSWIDNPRGSLMVSMYYIAHWASKNKKRRFYFILCYPVLVVYKILTEFVFGYEIPAATIIGQGFFVDHGYSCVINKNTIIGENFRMKHGVTIGCQTLKNGEQGPSPVIGDDVDVGAGAIILGGIVVGNNVKIGAGAIVVTDVPDDCIVICERAKSIKYENKI